MGIKNMRRWVVLRCAIMLVSAAGALFTPLRPQASPPIEWGALLVIFLFCTVGMAAIFMVHLVALDSAKKWARPSWRLNPFDFRQPLQFFQLGAYVCSASGLVVLARLAVLQVPFYVEALVPFAIAFGGASRYPTRHIAISFDDSAQCLAAKEGGGIKFVLGRALMASETVVGVRFYGWLISN
ncbi:hypothetical protein [Pseudoxanthomonas sp. JBR18]|uniref:hypothetical protein n=1 Tax=Pseudoxanthomonas sp. JBR18 TaxID=2969308 RepID=UPI0023057027|nr:hypothetical protein [Pseudoxanthomonas sp. JBR18]WCE04916.1 hypothetical protein PJ250_02695 [Pseudoxanthomonas sp. JBR18]